MSSLLLHFKKMLAYFAASTIIIISACNSNTKKVDESKVDSTGTPSDSTTTEDNGGTSANRGNNSTALWSGGFPTLLMTKAMLQDIFTSGGTWPKCKKTVFKVQFSDLTSSTSTQTLVAFGSKDNSNDYLSDAPQETLAQIDASIIPHVAIPGELYVGNVELTRKQWEDLRDDAGSNYATATHLMFTPMRSSEANRAKNLVYKVKFVKYLLPITSQGQITILSTEEELKPSPPAPPSN